MRTWDYRAFLIEPLLALLEHIVDPRICNLSKESFFGCVINRTDRPILIKKSYEKLCITHFDLDP